MRIFINIFAVSWCNALASFRGWFQEDFSMRKLAVLTVFAVSMSGAYALNAQQQLMGTCNAQAKASNKTGDERKAFMKSCLADGRKAQQEKMKTCNVEAKDKKGDERKAFMKACLSKK